MKEELIKLAKEVGFKSEMFTDTEWKFNSKEDLRYYLKPYSILNKK